MALANARSTDAMAPVLDKLASMISNRDLRTDLAPAVAGQARVFCCHKATLSGLFPPNSLLAVEDCVEHRVPRLEIDVRFLADDRMLVFHDGSLDSETTGSGRVDALMAVAVRDLRFRADESVPLSFLEDVVDVLRQGESLLQVDLKLRRPISAVRLDALAGVLQPIRDRVLVGSQAHWNLRGLPARGIPVAIDPTLQWQYAPSRESERALPFRRGLHGLWDDAPIAHVRGVSFTDYCGVRIADIVGLLPEAREWMVDIATIRQFSALGVHLGNELGRRGIELAAWTMVDEGPGPSSEVLKSLFSAGVTTVITDAATKLAGYAASLS